MIKYKTIWLLGLSSSGKTTIANKLKEELTKIGIDSILIDGDDFRKIFTPALGYTEDDRFDNIRKAREYCMKCNNHNITVIASFITPYEEMREENREMIGKKYFEVWVNAPLEVCMQRDVKGLYKKKTKLMTGVEDDFDELKSSDLICYTDKETIEESVNKVLKEVLQ